MPFKHLHCYQQVLQVNLKHSSCLSNHFHILRDLLQQSFTSWYQNMSQFLGPHSEGSLGWMYFIKCLSLHCLWALNSFSVLSITCLVYWWLTVFYLICVVCGAHRDPKRALGPLELKIQVTVTHPTWFLGAELGSSEKAASVLNH